MANLEIYVLNVGEGDTAIIKTPDDNIVVIDAYLVNKVRSFLAETRPDGEISHLIVTHPHEDHYGAVRRLLRDQDRRVRHMILAPFWIGSDGRQKTYCELVSEIQEQHIPLRFLSGYERIYLDGGAYPEYLDKPVLELLGPSNQLLKDLQDGDVLKPNHLSIVARLNYGRFSMVFAADAQVQNWATFLREGMQRQCDVLKAAHHGSARGTQFETLEALSPKLVIVSSDPNGRHELPDSVGSTTYMEYHESHKNRTVVLTAHTGSIRIVVDRPQGRRRRYKVSCYREEVHDERFPWPESDELPATDWGAMVKERQAKLPAEERVAPVVVDPP